jgi:hypothetical protein
MAIVYNTSVVRTGLVLHLDAANPKSYPGTGNTWFDISGNGLNAVTVNNPTFSSGSFTFNGTSQYAYIPYAASLAPTSEITLSSWVTTDWQTTGNVRIVSKTEGGGYQLSINDIAGQTGCTIHVGGTYRYSTVPRANISSGWHNMLATCDGRYVRLYFDSILINTIDIGSTLSLTYANNNNFVIAAEAGPGAVNSIASGYLAGSISSISVYNRALTAGEIQQNFEATRGRYGI